MNKNRSIIYNLPIKKFDSLLDKLGIEKTWQSVLATNLKNYGKKDLFYILEENEFKDAKIQEYDFIKDLSVGEISVLYEYSLAYVNRDKRKKEGQYFTPDDIAQIMAKRAALFPKNKTWVDPCSGIGNLSFWLAKKQSDPENFIKNNLFLIDRDELALFIARFIFATNFQDKDKIFFNNIKARFIVADFLESEKLPGYDYAILNPPYVLTKSDDRFETSQARDLYAYFLEKIIKTTQGFVSITPQTFTNGQKFKSFRGLLIDNFSNIKIYCFDNVPDSIFRGIKFGSKNTNKANSTRAGIIVASKKENEKSFKITPLLRWRSKDRKQFLGLIDGFLTEVNPSANIFPKIHRDFLPLYKMVETCDKTLANFVSSSPTKYRLTVPSTPRYFISALKRPISRSSFKTLYFYNEQEYNFAYLLLNSSYMYWWWRVNDGGMTISEKTLLTLPIVKNIIADKDLLSKVEKSETTNLVIKRNAGKDNENVKHDLLLINEINKKMFPNFANILGKLHNNSVI